jgi:hypothetical protein
VHGETTRGDNQSHVDAVYELLVVYEFTVTGLNDASASLDIAVGFDTRFNFGYSLCSGYTLDRGRKCSFTVDHDVAASGLADPGGSSELELDVIVVLVAPPTKRVRTLPHSPSGERRIDLECQPHGASYRHQRHVSDRHSH